MAGGLMQLVAYGAQDIYLTGNPMITYFKVVYRRHTNFAIESIQQTFNGSTQFGGPRLGAVIPRNGDLINAVYIQVELPDVSWTSTVGNTGAILRWTDNIGHHLLQQMDVEIGGQLVDRQYSDWLEIWAQLTVPAGQQRGYREMIGQDPLTDFGIPQGLQAAQDISAASGTIRGRTIYVPLQFWFCRNVGLSIPLIALQYHEVKIYVTFSSFSSLIINQNGTVQSGTSNTFSSITVSPPNNGFFAASLWIDYIYLDTDERRRFAQVTHEYLIEQVQTQTAIISPGVEVTIPLVLNHPVKEIIWVCRSEAAEVYNKWSNYTTHSATLHSGRTASLADVKYDMAIDASTSTAYTYPTGIQWGNLRTLTNQSMTAPPNSLNPVTRAKLQFNGQERFAAREGDYFNLVQSRDRHTNIPDSPGINVYSFALRPEEHQPSGSCNFSRIDVVKLIMTTQSGIEPVDFTVPDNRVSAVDFSTSRWNVSIFATNYNILRIMSGMGAVAYTS